MDEVNHVNMVVSFVLFGYAGYFFVNDGYECSINIFYFVKRLLKFYFCRLLECFIALR